MRQIIPQKSIYFFIGTTAELIKIAPIIKELNKRKIPFKLIASGQRRILFEDLEGFIGPLKPNISLVERGTNPSPIFFLLWAIKTFIFGLFQLRGEFRHLKKKNTYFIVHGDTVSTFIGSIISYIYKVKLVHVESGDLSFNLLEPFPEEVIRQISIRLADVLFAPNKWAAANLKHVSGKIINTKQNTLIESFWWAIEKKKKSINIRKYKKYYILLLHRQEHVVFRKNWSKKTLQFIIDNSDKNLNCLLVNHHLTSEIIQSLKLTPSQKKRTILMPPMSYPNFMKLLGRAEFIATDSAFNQLEANLMGIPYLGLRNYTEQIEGLGKNVVICKNNENVIKNFLKNYQKYKSKIILNGPKPSKIIVDYLIEN